MWNVLGIWIISWLPVAFQMCAPNAYGIGDIILDIPSSKLNAVDKIEIQVSYLLSNQQYFEERKHLLAYCSYVGGRKRCYDNLFVRSFASPVDEGQYDVAVQLCERHSNYSVCFCTTETREVSLKHSFQPNCLREVSWKNLRPGVIHLGLVLHGVSDSKDTVHATLKQIQIAIQKYAALRAAMDSPGRVTTHIFIDNSVADSDARELVSVLHQEETLLAQSSTLLYACPHSDQLFACAVNTLYSLSPRTEEEDLVVVLRMSVATVAVSPHLLVDVEGQFFTSMNDQVFHGFMHRFSGPCFALLDAPLEVYTEAMVNQEEFLHDLFLTGRGKSFETHASILPALSETLWITKKPSLRYDGDAPSLTPNVLRNPFPSFATTLTGFHRFRRILSQLGADGRNNLLELLYEGGSFAVSWPPLCQHNM